MILRGSAFHHDEVPLYASSETILSLLVEARTHSDLFGWQPAWPVHQSLPSLAEGLRSGTRDTHRQSVGASLYCGVKGPVARAGSISPYSGRDCVKPLRSFYTGLYPPNFRKGPGLASAPEWHAGGGDFCYCRGSSLIRNSAPLGNYSRTKPRAPWWPLGKEVDSG